MIKRRLTGAVVALALAAGAAVGCGSSPSASSAGQKPVLTIGLNSAGTNFNPAVNIAGAQMFSLAYAGITHLNPDGTVAPALATSWSYVGTGNETFEFTLRHDARFSDGTPVTASAVKACITVAVSR